MRSHKILGLIFLMGMLTSVLTIGPMIKAGVAGVFYTIDPDVQYLSNSFSYIEKGQIQYDVHPGTPTIMLHAWVLWPLRIYTKLITGEPFITWVFRNISWVYLYVRVFQAIWLGIATGIFLGAIYRLTKSAMVLVLAWLGLLVYSVFPYLGSTIVPETTSFFLTALWLWIFAGMYKSVSIRRYLILSAVAGLAIANKFSNLTLMLATLPLIGFLPQVKIKKKIAYSLGSILMMIFTFFIATWPIRKTYLNLWGWISILASTTGTHGGGERALFDLTAYLKSAGNLIHREWWPTLIVTAIAIMLMGMILRDKVKLISPLSILAGVALTAILLFAKFPLSHYQLINYVLIIFAGAILLSHLPKITMILALAIFIPAVTSNLQNYGQLSLAAMTRAARLERYVTENSSTVGTLWEWARNKDFSFLWSRDWAHGVFDKELALFRPDLLAITPDMKMIKINNREFKDVFEVCWDKFYIQSVSAPRFLAMYADENMRYGQLPGIEEIGLIESSHCQND